MHISGTVEKQDFGSEEHIRRGLSEEEVEASRAKWGKNKLTPPKRPSVWRLYIDKFRDPIIRVLIVAALLAFVIAFYEKNFTEPIGILCAILLATGIGFYFEYDAARKFDILNAIGNETMVKVVRSGVVKATERKELVVGDVILLEAGDEIPADARMMKGENVLVNESSLTGEPSARKSTDEGDGHAPYPQNMLLRGTIMLEGSAVAAVTAVGDATEIGKTAREATKFTADDTPLNRQLRKLADFISRIGYLVAAVAFLIFTWQGLCDYYNEVQGWANMQWPHIALILVENFMLAMTLIVMAVPEGLPMAVTLSLALNMRRMLKTNNLVRIMHACETMGAVTVICTDKTGTLTQNRMTVSEMVWDKAQGALLDEAIACNTTAFLNEERSGGLGNPTEVALLLWMAGHGADYRAIRRGNKRLGRLLFSSQNKYMATVSESATARREILFVKGAPEILLPLCEGLSEEEKTNCLSRLASWQEHAQRTLLIAYKIMGTSGDIAAMVGEGGLTMLALCAISDPVRQEVPPAVEKCLHAGVKIKVVTGDSTGTAVEIARQIGLWNEEDKEGVNSIRGAEFAALGDEEALVRIKDIKVMSRARPMDKLRLVNLLKRQGEIVAVTGDGTNDAPALHNAHVGLSMGSGTSVAKEASAITLLDDSFRSVVTAVMWGRSLYKNIQRFVLFQLTINFTALMVVLLGSFLGKTLPLTVTQILWINIIMDSFAAMALASLPAEESVMEEKPRPESQFIITRAMWRAILGYGIVFVGILLCMLWHFGKGVDIHELTVFFTTFVMLHFWNLLNAKTFGTVHSAFHNLKQDKGVLLVLGMILAGQFLIVTFGGAVFRTVPLEVKSWGWILVSTFLVLVTGELIRGWKRLRLGRGE